MIDREKRVFFSTHARTKMSDRGASEEEVIEAVREGSFEPARKGRLLFRKNFPFGRSWRGKRYFVKQVAPVIAEEKDKLIVITVYVYYF
jgi:hypothetical protein